MSQFLLELLNGGEDALTEAKERGMGESLTLDFKADGNHPEARMFQQGKLTPRGRAVIGKALSAFSNSAGGVLVLGVDSRSVEGVDRIQDLAPLENIEVVFNSVQSAIGELLQPRHDGIQVYKVESAIGSGRGYVAIEVPRSERRPHRCEAKDEKQYFKRSGTSSFAMEHYDIEDAFHRSSSPALMLDFEWRTNITTPIKKTIELTLAVRNEGHITAKNIGLIISRRDGISVKWKPVSGGNHTRFQVETIMAPATLVCHPGNQRAVIANGEVDFHRLSKGELYVGGVAGSTPGQLSGSLPVAAAFLSLTYEIVADDMRPVERTLEFTSDQLSAVPIW